MNIERVNMGFTRDSVAGVVGTTLAVDENLYGNPYFATPPVLQAELQSARVALEDAQGKMAQGGTAATAVRNNAMEALVLLLRKLAIYVQEESGNDLAKLLSSGFTAVSKNRAPVELPVPAEVKLTAGIAGQLLVSVKRLANARCYEVQMALVAADGQTGEWSLAGIYTRSRGMRLDSLVSGQLYAVRLRAVGGLTGYSGWTNTVIGRCL